MSVQPHEHGPHAHTHTPSAAADRRLLAAALALLLVYMTAELVAGLLAHSSALLADAGHMLTDAASLALALTALRLAARPARGAFTYGLRRVEILSAQANGVTLVLFAVFFVVEGVRRLVDPPEVRAGLVLVVALCGIAVNAGATWLLARADRTSLNVEGTFQHVLTDLYAFAGTALAAVVVLTTGWQRADPVATLLVAALMLLAGVRLVRDSGRVFLEASPRGIDPDALAAQLRATPGVLEVHELHVWEVTSGFPALSAHVLVDLARDCHATRVELEALLHDGYGIAHTTLQVDHRVDHRDELLPLPTRRHEGHVGDLGSTGDHDAHAHDCA